MGMATGFFFVSKAALKKNCLTLFSSEKNSKIPLLLLILHKSNKIYIFKRFKFFYFIKNI